MDPHGSGRIPYDDGSFSPSGSNGYSNANYRPYYPPFPPPPPRPPNPYTHQDFGGNSSWYPPYPPPPPGPVYPHTQLSSGGWMSSNSFSQEHYSYHHQGSFHSDISYQHPQTSGFYSQTPSGFAHSPSDLDRQNNNPPIYSHAEATALPTNPPSSATSTSTATATATSLYPLHDLFSELQLSPNPPAVESPSPTSSFHGRPRPGSQSFEYSSQSFSSDDGSFSGHSLQYGQYSMNFYDNLSSDSSLGAFGSQDYDKLQIVPFQPSEGSLKIVLLHGTLDVWIFEAKNLPNMDLFSEKLRQIFTITGSGKIEQHASRNKIITSDPYVSIWLCNAVVARTRVISNDQNPVWTQHFSIPVAHHVAEVFFVVKDSDFMGAQLIGNVAIPAERIMAGQKIDDWFPVLGSNGKVCKAGAALKLSIQYFPVENQPLYKSGVGAGPNYVGVPNTYFPLRKGAKVTLYQDAHVPDNYLPAIKLDQQIAYEHGKCWQDICEAISQARRLIYITGWSVYHKIKLVHENNLSSLPSDSTLGDLLKFKSQEGLRVLLLVWDDPTSREILGIRTEGLMQTHDEETRRFFKHSSVQVLLCPRYAGKRHSWVKQQEVGTIFTHHQKSVLVDTQAAGGRRKIIAFLGGLDLCDGRFDTPEHSLFRSLRTVHMNDYHNPTFAASIDFGGPREPWHDLHCKIDGPAAYDVLTNFEQRWHKAAKRHGIGKLKRWNDDALLKLERVPDIIGFFQLNISDENDPETWHVQIFRSIDSSSVKGFPKDVQEAETRNLVYGKNVVIDMSIHTAYVKAIRSAQHFIYIENQYFIGSSYNWSSHRDIGANNLIPMELALKIARKIRANERFAVYILIPMWPEGVPTSPLMQRILFWQGQTMQMMYEIISKALEEVGLEKMYHPQDYLNFFCLGNREVRDENETPPRSAPLENTPHARAQKSRRFMIYVHSKGMIVDDEYIILGSANINQRSMDGSRDSEIAMGAYQPQYTWAKKRGNPHGQVNASWPPKKMAILDRSNGSRQLQNKFMVASILSQMLGIHVRQGFSGVGSFCDQVRAVAEEDLIVVPHGSQNVNLIFARKGAVVIEVFPFLFYTTALRNYTHAAQLHLYPLLGDIPNNNFLIRLLSVIGWDSCFEKLKWCKNYSRRQFIHADIEELKNLLLQIKEDSSKWRN